MLGTCFPLGLLDMLRVKHFAELLWKKMYVLNFARNWGSAKNRFD